MWPFRKKAKVVTEVGGRLSAVFTPPLALAGVLPPWATSSHSSSRKTPIINVDAREMYDAWLGELREYYATSSVPSEWLDPEIGVIKPEWSACLDDLFDASLPTSYWLESAYQCGKMELQAAMRTFAFQINIQDFGKVYNQEWADLQYEKAHDRKPSRTWLEAAGGGAGGREARDHFKRLRGFVPS